MCVCVVYKNISIIQIYTLQIYVYNIFLYRFTGTLDREGVLCTEEKY